MATTKRTPAKPGSKSDAPATPVAPASVPPGMEYLTRQIVAEDDPGVRYVPNRAAVGISNRVAAIIKKLDELSAIAHTTDDPKELDGLRLVVERVHRAAFGETLSIERRRVVLQMLTKVAERDEPDYASAVAVYEMEPDHFSAMSVDLLKKAARAWRTAKRDSARWEALRAFLVDLGDDAENADTLRRTLL